MPGKDIEDLATSKDKKARSYLIRTRNRLFEFVVKGFAWMNLILLLNCIFLYDFLVHIHVMLFSINHKVVLFTNKKNMYKLNKNKNIYL